MFCPTCKCLESTNNLEGVNQIKIKNPINDMMENEVNDTPFKIETKSEVMKAREVVLIPEGSNSLSESSKKEREVATLTSPDIYKKEAPPPTRATHCDI